MRVPLRSQILLPFAGLLMVVVLATSAVNAWLAARSSEARIAGQLREIARTLLESSFPLTDAVLRQTSGLSGVQFAVTAEDGSPVASSGPLGDLPTIAAVEQWQQLGLGQPQTIGDEAYFHAAVKLAARVDRVEPGQLHIIYPEKAWREARWQAVYPPLVVGAFALAAVGVVATAIASRLSRPMLQLKHQVGRLAAGDFAQVPLPARDDELRDLAESVNSLAGQLEELRRVIKRSERLSLLGQLSGGLAHHLRNDVTGAKMAIELHGRSCGRDAESLAVARRQLVLAEQHVQQFLAAGQPRALQRKIDNLGDVIDDLLPLVEPTCQHRGVDLQVAAVSESLPDFPIDAEQMRQAILNLILNGIEAAGQGGWVRVECRASEARVLLRVSDSGPGVSGAIVDRLFEPFATTKQEGVGLGLTAAKQIVEAHGGTLVYRRESATCFRIELPIDAASSLSVVVRAADAATLSPANSTP